MVYVDFKINQDSIAEELCINKDLPGATLCYGSCYLTVQLEKIDDQRQKQLPNYLKDKKQIAHVEDLWVAEKALPKFKLVKKFEPTHNVVFHSSNYLDNVFHPPQLS